MKSDWELTQEEFDRLLAWLDPEREKAGAKFWQIRERITKLLIARGCHEAEEVFYETVRRIARKPSALFAAYDGDPAKYVYGVAHKVHHEWAATQPAWAALPPALATHQADNKEEQAKCLEQCLQHLGPDAREVLERYYRGTGQTKINTRKALASELNLSDNALRLRISRLRQLVASCLEKCLERK